MWRIWYMQWKMEESRETGCNCDLALIYSAKSFFYFLKIYIWESYNEFRISKQEFSVIQLPG